MDEKDSKKTNMNSEDSSINSRGHWDSKMEYILTMVGHCVGLGNIWRFPYLCMRNGGGAFVVPYVVCLVIYGLPLYFLEVSIGQFSGKGFFHVWSVCPLFKGIGVGMFIFNLVVIFYYNLINAWALYYMGSSFYSPLPWTNCDNEWNTKHCITESYTSDTNNSTVILNNSSLVVNSSNSNDLDWLLNTSAILHGRVNESIVQTTSQEEFWFKRVLHLSDGLHEMGDLDWRLAVSYLAAWIVVCLCLIKGIKSVGKVVYVTALLPYVLLIVILVRGLMLPGAIDGIIFYLRPEFHKLADPQVWLEAALQVFYSLGPAWGPVITLASYNKFNNNCFRDSFLLVSIAEGTSLFGGLVVFTVIGYMAKLADKPIQDVVQAGPGLAFLAYPEALSTLPLPNVWTTVFFLMLFSVGIDSQFTSVEACLTTVCDVYPSLRRRRESVSILFSVFAVTAGLILCTRGGLYVFQLIDWYIASLSLPLFGLCECLVFGWIYGAEMLSRDIEIMIGRGVPVYMRVAWCFVNPALLLAILGTSLYLYTPPVVGEYVYPPYGRAIGWGIAVLPLLPLPIFAIKAIMEARGDTFYERMYTGGSKISQKKVQFKMSFSMLM
ncbi:sodium- and chloride-dependent betaine transporter-like isoform X2 [Ostrea edulis]|uniref:sodium- and chloride-dependent betaine transporter-like isoform X2 n=1 Tax=Ostrea edulis TaxID=37623 RepID=UPI0024AF1273|nr:sodium- and chloride-dependent betaine transporter-like isoform X2 [Ostrea edulis]